MLLNQTYKFFKYNTIKLQTNLKKEAEGIDEIDNGMNNRHGASDNFM